MQLSTTVIEANLGFDGVGWIAWIVIGGIAGWLASKIMGTDAQQGLFLNIVVGVIGGVVGGIILRLLGVSTAGAGWILTLLTALAGSCVLLFVVGLVTGRRG